MQMTGRCGQCGPCQQVGAARDRYLAKLSRYELRRGRLVRVNGTSTEADRQAWNRTLAENPCEGKEQSRGE